MTGSYSFRPVEEPDIPRILEIYNGNQPFLVSHLGCASVDPAFLVQELQEMKRLAFLSYVIINTDTGDIIGVIDYQPQNTVYLSLLMLDSALHKSGIGSRVYHQFERQMAEENRPLIRIDVVNDYSGNMVGFWEKQGFLPQKEIRLSWGQKESNALVMVKHLNARVSA